MLVEDNPTYARLLEVLLEDHSRRFVLTHVANLAEGCERLQDTPFDAVLLDLHLPDSFGLETLAKLKAASPNIPIIVMTGLQKEDLGINAVANGAQDYLLKETIDGNGLARAIRYSLERHRLLKRLEQKVQRVESNFYNLVQENVDSMLIVTKAGKVTFANTAAQKLFAKSEQDLIGKSFGFPLEPNAATEIEVVRGRGDSSIVEMRLVTLAWQGQEAYLASLRDISERKQFERQLEYQAHHDTLTGLPNRRYIEWHFEKWTKHHAFDQRKLVMIYFDLNRFKQVNDTLGHPAGDELLRQVGDRLMSIKRGSDVVARISGDEFALLISVADDREAKSATERLISMFDRPFNVFEQEVSVGASFGIAVLSDTDKGFRDLLRRADIAMYHAKINKKSYAFYSPAADQQFKEQGWIETELKEALATEALELYYQPIVKADTGKRSSAEALLRWRHPDKGVISANDFIPKAEAIGLMSEIDHWVVQQAIRQASEGRFSVAVNISAKSLQTDAIIESTLMSLEANRLAPQNLCIEITEHALADTRGALQALKQLHKQGVKIAVDDFGTGYSSLAYLDMYPLNVIKIDRRFVQTSMRRPRTMAITKSILQLAHDLELQTVAEGIETAEEYHCFKQLGCSYIQGYLTGRPVPFSTFANRTQQTDHLSL